LDIFAILDTVRRHWVATVVVAAAVLVGATSLLVLMPRHYEATASYVLINPAPDPTQDEIAADPSLASVNRNNPYLRFANPATVGQVLAGRVSSDEVRGALEEMGADAAYTVAPSPDFGGSGQVMDVVGTGTSARVAELTLKLVDDRMSSELHDMQKVYGADDSALIVALPVAAPTKAHVVLSGTVRALVGFVGAGVLALFTVISIAEARNPGPGRSARGRSAVRGEPVVEVPSGIHTSRPAAEKAVAGRTSAPAGRAPAPRGVNRARPGMKRASVARR